MAQHVNLLSWDLLGWPATSFADKSVWCREAQTWPKWFGFLCNSRRAFISKCCCCYESGCTNAVAVVYDYAMNANSVASTINTSSSLAKHRSARQRVGKHTGGLVSMIRQAGRACVRSKLISMSLLLSLRAHLKRRQCRRALVQTWIVFLYSVPWSNLTSKSSGYKLRRKTLLWSLRNLVDTVSNHNKSSFLERVRIRWGNH